MKITLTTKFGLLCLFTGWMLPALGAAKLTAATIISAPATAALVIAKPAKNLVQKTFATVAKNKKLAGGIALAGAVMYGAYRWYNTPIKPHTPQPTPADTKHTAANSVTRDVETDAAQAVNRPAYQSQAAQSVAQPTHTTQAISDYYGNNRITVAFSYEKNMTIISSFAYTPNSDLASLKEQIAQKFGIPAHLQCLICNGSELSPKTFSGLAGKIVTLTRRLTPISESE